MGFWSTILKYGGKAMRGAGQATSAAGKSMGNAVLHPSQTLRGAGSQLNGVSNFMQATSGGGLLDMLGGFFSNLGRGNVSGLSIAGLVAAAFLVFGQRGWLGKIAGLFLGMLLIGNNAGVLRTAPQESVSRTQTPALSPEEQTQSGGMRR